MTHGKQKPIVPITREFLRQFYQKYPLAPVPYDARVVHLNRVGELADAVTKPGSKVPDQFGMPSPTRIDDCFWRNRMICEELALFVSKLQEIFTTQPELVASCQRCHSLLVSAERSIFAVQEHNTASVKAQLQQFIPHDFRGALLERQRVLTEARYKKQVEDLVKRGGTIRQKYDLYLQQQWERRQALVQLGECSGMYKMVIKWVAGIPQVLLDFAKEINAKLGPMEEQRIKYGPDLYGITELGLRLDVCLAAWAESAAADVPGALAAQLQFLDVVEPAIAFYCEQMLRVVRHIGDVFQCSPFFVKKDDLEGQSGVDDGGSRIGDGGAEGKEENVVAAAVGVSKHHSHVDAEYISSNLSAASASGDDGGVGAVDHAGMLLPTATGAVAAAAPLPSSMSQAPFLSVPATPVVMLEALPRTATQPTTAAREVPPAPLPATGTASGSCGEVELRMHLVVPAASAAITTAKRRQEELPQSQRDDATSSSSAAETQLKAVTCATCSSTGPAGSEAPAFGAPNLAGSVGSGSTACPATSPTAVPAAGRPSSISILAGMAAIPGSKMRSPPCEAFAPSNLVHANQSGLVLSLPPAQQQQQQSSSGSGQAQRLSGGRSGLRIHLSSDSHISFVSALELQPWYSPEENVAEMQLLQLHHHHQKEQEQQQKQQEDYPNPQRNTRNGQDLQQQQQQLHQYQKVAAFGTGVRVQAAGPPTRTHEERTQKESCFPSCFGRRHSRYGQLQQGRSSHGGAMVPAVGEAGGVEHLRAIRE